MIFLKPENAPICSFTYPSPSDHCDPNPLVCLLQMNWVGLAEIEYGKNGEKVGRRICCERCRCISSQKKGFLPD